MLAEPVVWHFSGDWGRLPLVAAADDLDTPTLEPVEEGFQSGAGHCADLVPYDQTGNKLLSHLFGRPVCLAAPAEEAVISLGQDAPCPHLFGQAMGRGEDEGVSGTEELDRSRGFAAAPPPPPPTPPRLGSSSGSSTAGHRAAARCWEWSFLLRCNRASRCRPHSPVASRSARLCPATDQGRPGSGGSLPRVNRART